MNTISTDELKAKVDRGDRFQLVEVLAPQQYEEWHLPGAINIPLDRLSEQAAVRLPQREDEVIVYCSGPACQASSRAARQLETLGYRHVRHYKGGKEEWHARGFAVEHPARIKQ